MKGVDGSLLAALLREYLRSKTPPGEPPPELSGVEGLPEHYADRIALRETLIADTSRKAARKIDVLARYGGEEFAVVFPETGIREAGIVAERFRNAIEATPLPCGKGTIHLTASFGVAAFDPASLSGRTYAESLQRLIRRADEALYRAKRSGKNRVEFAA